MEVLGAVAAGAQLCGILFKAIDSTARLRDTLRHMPAQYKSWDNELAILEETISFINDSPSLHTESVRRLVDIITNKIEGLTTFCKEYSPPSQARFLTKLLWVPRARSIESRILQSFESLEHDKTTLILLISLSNGSISIENFRQAIMGIQEKSSSQSSIVSRHGLQGLFSHPSI
ncbi:hypothetical protein RRF57_008948 [Xylaria bambusicola]|uniref:Uncharacterized protein n=1 Tax=Xylaria bambusicola TaxID=326684 RepID=A0AAN7USW5_9PEZI